MEQVITKRRYYDIGLQIEELLYSGVFKAGERLPSERELSERFNTSRTTIREAIIMLELKGVLNVKQGSGIFFVDSTDKLSQKSLMPYSEIGPFELLQARQVIESNITGFAASQISFNELQELKKIIRLQENAIAAESDKFEDLDHRFHSIIAEATQNRVLIKQAAELWRAVRTENPAGRNLTTSTCMKSICVCNGWKITGLFSWLCNRKIQSSPGSLPRHLENSKNELIKIFKQDASISDFDDFFFAR